MYHESVMDDRRKQPSVSRPSRRTRPYRQRARAEQQAATRQQIADAALELHATVGPARTTVSAVAERAGVERLTVYRHFPDERALFTGCSSRFLEQHPPPDLSAPMAIARFQPRLEAVLLALYAYYGDTRDVMAALLRDEPFMPVVAEFLVPYRQLLSGIADTVAVDVPPRRRRIVRAATRHGLAFETWRSLTTDGGLTDAEAAALMAGLVTSIRGGDHPPQTG